MKRRFILLLRPLAPLLFLVPAAACSHARPIHPYRLEGWPDARIEGDLFPLRDGRTWEFVDRLDPDRARLRLSLRRVEGRWVLRGRADGEVELVVTDEFLEIHGPGGLIERPLRRSGVLSRSWRAGSGRAFAFGYDRIEVLGEPTRALVVAIDRGDLRDLIWFADGIGWVRFRTEEEGRAVRDATLVSWEPGGAN